MQSIQDLGLSREHSARQAAAEVNMSRRLHAVLRGQGPRVAHPGMVLEGGEAPPVPPERSPQRRPPEAGAGASQADVAAGGGRAQGRDDGAAGAGRGPLAPAAPVAVAAGAAALGNAAASGQPGTDSLAAQPEALAAQPEALAAQPEALAAQPEALAAQPEAPARPAPALEAGAGLGCVERAREPPARSGPRAPGAPLPSMLTLRAAGCSPPPPPLVPSGHAASLTPY
jgi:hypothetical protein